MQVILVIGLGVCFITAGLLMVYIAAIDIKTRLISSCSLFCLVLIRLAAAFISFSIDPMLLSECFTGEKAQFIIEQFDNRGCPIVLAQEGNELGIVEVVARGICCLCTQFSFSSLFISGINSLIAVLFLQLLVFVTDAIVLKKRAKKLQRIKSYRRKLYGKNNSSTACDMTVRGADICEMISSERENKTRQVFESSDVSSLKNKLANKGSKNASLGSGDVLLVGVCCLYLIPVQMEVFFLVIALGGIVLAGLTYLARRETTFPFAPVIVLGCMIAFLF